MKNYKYRTIKNKPCIGKSIIEKFQEYMETGDAIGVRERESKSSKHFDECIWNSTKKAEDLVKQGITSIEELENKDKLNDKQLIGLKYYYDILERIQEVKYWSMKLYLKKFLMK